MCWRNDPAGRPRQPRQPKRPRRARRHGGTEKAGHPKVFVFLRVSVPPWAPWWFGGHRKTVVFEAMGLTHFGAPLTPTLFRGQRGPTQIAAVFNVKIVTLAVVWLRGLHPDPNAHPQTTCVIAVGGPGG
jgi:hypothetical protein